MTSPRPGLDLGEILRDKLADQPWYRTYANTATTLVTLGVNVLWVLVSLGVDIDPTIIGTVAAGIQALGVVGVKLTPNGVTTRQIDELEQYVGKHRK
ncbi:hypothetical protein L5I01_17540 [Gordonia sp. HY442]|uniref:hypothetical protein n=1 Tax=Gordonia zhenghanii TaxID=2911516 RepID=UPI001F322ADF|nr:hypothetical protein [Gordonia zhenghanii]MCF8605160.1 hypothetical protein [Gordonia zhenghanii]